MNTFESQDFQIAYDDIGDGDPIILLHGFAADRRPNWRLTGWYKRLSNAGWLFAKKLRRFKSVVINGTGLNLLQVDDPKQWTSRGFTLTADNKKSESLTIPSTISLYGKVSKLAGRAGALFACLPGSFPNLPEEVLARARTPTLVIAGSRDTAAGSPVPVAESVPGAKAVIAPGRSHLSCVTDGFFKGAVLGFLGCR